MLKNRDALMRYRIKNAKEKLSASELLYESGKFKDSVNRSYYAMFSAVRAVLALDGVDFSKHAGVIAYFQKEYVKTEKFPVKYSKYISMAFQIRNNCDYADFFVIAKDDAKEQLLHAKDFIAAVEEFIKTIPHLN